MTSKRCAPCRSITVAADMCTRADTLTTLAMLQGEHTERVLKASGVRYWIAPPDAVYCDQAWDGPPCVPLQSVALAASSITLPLAGLNCHSFESVS